MLSVDWRMDGRTEGPLSSVASIIIWEFEPNNTNGDDLIRLLFRTEQSQRMSDKQLLDWLEASSELF